MFTLSNLTTPSQSMNDSLANDSEELFTLQIPSKIESIAMVEGFLEELCNTYNVSPETYANIMTAMNEAVVNAILHGNANNFLKKVYINLEVQNRKRFVFTVADEGNGFDYNKVNDPTLSENLELGTGRGIFIIKHLADQVIFNERGNQLELHFKI